MKSKHFSGSSWESVVGYSRAQRVDNIIEVAGTTSSDGQNIVGKGDAYLQTMCILEKIIGAIEALGGQASDIIRTRIFVTNMKDWQEVGRAHGHYFKDICPAATMVEVSALIDPELLVEIEATAVISKS